MNPEQNPLNIWSAGAFRQSGAALISGLIFLVVLTMIGVTSARMSTLEERMSGNMRDRSIAMQAAELALRDAERDVLGKGSAPRSPAISGGTDFGAECDQDATEDTFDDGLCDRRGGPATYTTTSITWPEFDYEGNNYPVFTLDMSGDPAVEYGTFTGAAAIPGLSQLPRYVIEAIIRKNPGKDDDYYYRITVRSQGVSDTTVVWLQEIFKI